MNASNGVRVVNLEWRARLLPSRRANGSPGGSPSKLINNPGYGVAYSLRFGFADSAL